MRGGVVGSFCFLAFLLSSGAKGQNVLNSQDLQGSENDGLETNVALEQHKRDVSNDKISVQDDSNVGGERSNALLAANSGSSQGNQGFTGVSNWSVPSNIGSSNAQASANAQASGNAGGNNPGLGYGYAGSNAANPQAATNAQALENAGRNNPGLGYGYPGSDAGNSQATANALSSKNGHQDYPWYPISEQGAENKTRAVAGEKNDVDADHDMPEFEKVSRMGGGFGEYSNNGAFAGAVSRVVSQAEYIYPDLIPGGQNAVTCSRDHEIHTIWSPIYQCMVCVCVQEGWTLRPICVTCNSCMTKPAPKPLPTPQPSIVIPPPPPPLIPESQVSCSPLPTNTPFENPLNPCQTCVCKKVVNVFGQEDVQIKCEENPSCITPPEYVPIPPLSPKPVPMPLCESLPANVPFPHPTEPCTVCKCVVEMSPYLIPERRMTCQHDFDNCGPTPTIPPQPPATDYPIIPYPTTTPPPQPTLPPYATEMIKPTEIEPIPWPPIVEPLPRPPSPLPGPPPHDTCKPYPPNTPFQHPWDECQICVCSEIYGNNVVNIEVNCYTKKSCCIEPPIPEPPLSLPYKPVPQLPSPGFAAPPSYGNLIFIEPKCRYRAPNQPYVVDCSICTCETVYQYVYAKCVPQPNCGLLSTVGQSSAQTQAEAISSAQSGFNNQYPYSLGGQSSAQTQAEAISSAQSGFNNQYPYSLGGQSSAQAQAGAISSAQSGLSNQYPYSLGGQSSAHAQAEAISSAQSGFNNQYPYSLGGQSSAQAQAEALANAQSELFNQYPYSLGGQSSAQAHAEAAASSQSGIPYGIYGQGGQSSAQAQADALGQSNSLSPFGIYGQGAQSSAQAQSEAMGQSGLHPYGYPYSAGSSQSSAQADSLASAQTIGMSPFGSYPYSQTGSTANSQALALGSQNSMLHPFGGSQSIAQAQAEATAASQMYPSLYPNQPGNKGPLYHPGVNGWDSNAQSQAAASAQASAQSDAATQALLFGASLANAQSQTMAQGSGATAQSLAQAAALSGRPLIRSGKGLCKYAGDKYHHNCQACYCIGEASGEIYTLCLGNPCSS